MQRSMAHRASPHSTQHDAGVSSYGPKTEQAWREERERRGGREPDSTRVTYLSIWSAKKNSQVGQLRPARARVGVGVGVLVIASSLHCVVVM